MSSLAAITLSAEHGPGSGASVRRMLGDVNTKKLRSKACGASSLREACKLASPAFLAKFHTMNAALAAEIDRLSSAEKLLLVEELWNQIARDSNAVEPPAWHDKVLAEDAARYAADPSRGDSWPDAKRRITGQA